MEFSIFINKRFHIFSYISGNRNLPKILYISGNENPKKLLIFQEMELFNRSSKNKNQPPFSPPKKNSFYFRKWNFLALILKKFLKESFSYISGNGNPEKTSYISESNFPSSKNKKNHSEKASYISGNVIHNQYIIFDGLE